MIELMITVAVVGILAAIAYPSYQEQVRKSKRAAAQGVLLEIASREQQLFLDARRYVAASDAAQLATSALRVTVPADLRPYYGFSAVVGTAADGRPIFTASAVPVAGGPQASDRCGTLSVNDANVKTASTSCGGTW